MHRALPTGSKLLSKKWEEKQKAALQKRIQTVKPSIDNKPPKQYGHLRANMKRAQLEEERYSAIEKQNRMLLGKMETIMKKRGSLDNHTEAQAKSLNFFVRKKEMIRITSENLAILRRIQHKEPSYNHKQWEMDAKKHESILRNICEYPLVIGPDATSPSVLPEGGKATATSPTGTLKATRPMTRASTHLPMSPSLKGDHPSTVEDVRLKAQEAMLHAQAGLDTEDIYDGGDDEYNLNEFDEASATVSPVKVDRALH